MWQPRLYTRTLHTRAGEVELNVPKLRGAKFETAIIERYRGHDYAGQARIYKQEGKLKALTRSIIKCGSC